ncbi:hypothetical protein GPJ56_000237 [Histomonas meleagridis]|uniref:uncharacterized protein n=1 Tax=Histomonas meleagridis TaxID=135588 RepID=UPI003559C6E7|nr:hypothetical protein GPJ56_000237 [Histomonas meleagridis]KAH0799724.1 hypothetical protein GO595_007445 [Histomonas meleagridis]
MPTLGSGGEATYQRIDNTRARPECLALALMGIVLTISFGGITIYWFARKHGQILALSSLRSISPLYEKTIPPYFIASSKSIIPNIRKYQTDYSNITSIAYALEVSYRNKGLSSKYLDENQFLQLSESSISNILQTFCKNNENNRMCKTNNSILFFSSQTNSSSNVYPASFNKSETFSKNPLKFKTKDQSFIKGISKTKGKLINKNRPFLISSQIPMKRFWASCGSSTSSCCLSKLYPCHNGDFCYPNNFQMKSDFISAPYLHSVPGNYNTFLLLGYNDNFDFSKSQYITDNGGFILLSNWGYIGHSIDYLLSLISIMEERQICPNPSDISTWTPSTFECAVNHSNNISFCSDEITQKIGNTTIQGSIELKCIDSAHCKVNNRYVMLRDTNQFAVTEIDGIPYGNVINLDEKRIETIKSLPFDMLGYAFEPVEYPKPPNDDDCGFVLIPYSEFEWVEMNTVNGWNAFDLQVLWEEQSFDKQSKEFDYTYVRNSLRDFNFTTAKFLKMEDEIQI